MAKLTELLDSITDEDGIRSDFVDGVREAYTSDIEEITLGHETALSEQSTTHTAAIDQMNADHAAEIERIRNEKFDNMQNEDTGSTALPESFGEPIEEIITLENYWEVAV